MTEHYYGSAGYMDIISEYLESSKNAIKNPYDYLQKEAFIDYKVKYLQTYEESSFLTNEEKVVLSKLVENEFGLFKKGWDYLLRQADKNIELSHTIERAKYILNYDTDKHSLKALLFVLNSVIENFLSIHIIDNLFKNFSREITSGEKNLFMHLSPSEEYFFTKEDVILEEIFINQHRFYNWLSNKNIFTTFEDSLKNNYLDSYEDTSFHYPDPELIAEAYFCYFNQAYFNVKDNDESYTDQELIKIKQIIKGIENVSALDFLVFSELVDCEDLTDNIMEVDEKCLYTIQTFKDNWSSYTSKVDINLFKEKFSQNINSNYTLHTYLFIFAILENDIDNAREIFDFLYDSGDKSKYFMSDENFYKNLRDWKRFNPNVPWSLYKNIIEE